MAVPFLHPRERHRLDAIACCADLSRGNPGGRARQGLRTGSGADFCATARQCPSLRAKTRMYDTSFGTSRPSSRRKPFVRAFTTAVSPKTRAWTPKISRPVYPRAPERYDAMISVFGVSVVRGRCGGGKRRGRENREHAENH